MKIFEVNTEIYVGDKFDEVIEKIKAKKALIVTDSIMYKLGMTKKFENIFNKKNIEYKIFDEVEVDPSFEVVDKALNKVIDFLPDIIVGIGGGSSLDTAKSIKYFVKKYLNEFVPIYINLLLNDEQVKKELSQIIIEGHTDDVGSYIYNMELSQKRAFEVIKYIYDEMPNFKGKEELKSYITANGRSNIKVLRDNSGNIDRDKSRRVEFQFKLKEDETLMKIEKTLKEGN